MLKIFLFLLFLSLFPAVSFPQELKICEEGVEKCEPLLKDDDKYSKCMRLMCYDYYSESDKKEKDISKFLFKYIDIEDQDKTKKISEEKDYEDVQPCEYGLRKCDVLSVNPEYYWECVSDSCKNPDINAKPDCAEGIKTCVDRQKIYNDCMLFTCGDVNANLDNCPQASATCGGSLRSYWQCVYGVCLGPVGQYIKTDIKKKFMTVIGKNGKKQRIQVDKREPMIAGAPADLARTPPGVNPEEWVRDTPQQFMLMGNPIDTMQCIHPTSILDCPTTDTRSCICSDGSLPVMINGKPDNDGVF